MKKPIPISPSTVTVTPSRVATPDLPSPTQPERMAAAFTRGSWSGPAAVGRASGKRHSGGPRPAGASSQEPCEAGGDGRQAGRTRHVATAQRCGRPRAGSAVAGLQASRRAAAELSRCSTFVQLFLIFFLKNIIEGA